MAQTRKKATAKKTTANLLDKRYDFLLLFDVEQGNPNGDPDAGNQPRIDPETGHGIVTDVCLKRKVRDYVAIAARDGKAGDPKPGFEIYVKHRGILANEQKKAFQSIKAEPQTTPNEQAREWMCKTFYDVRTFGAVMTTGKAGKEKGEGKARGRQEKQHLWNCGQVRGPVQITFSRSVDPVLTLEHTITRVALTNVGDTGRGTIDSKTGEEVAGSGQMGRKNTIPYGLFKARGFVSPHEAAKTGFSTDDLDLLWQALMNMFEHDRSAARGLMSTRKLFVFEHESSLGNAPAHKLFDLVQVKRKDDTRTPRRFDDYEVTIDQNKLPKGITLHELL